MIHDKKSHPAWCILLSAIPAMFRSVMYAFAQTICVNGEISATLTATLTHIRVRDETRPQNQCHMCVCMKRIGISATVGETKLTSWRKRKPYPHRDEPEELQMISYSIGDPAHRLPDGKTTLIITGIRTDVTKAMWMSMVRYWENVGVTAKATLLFQSLRSDSDCSEIDRADGSRKAEKAISDSSGRIAHVATKTALNRFWRLLLLWP